MSIGVLSEVWGGCKKQVCKPKDLGMEFLWYATSCMLKLIHTLYKSYNAVTKTAMHSGLTPNLSNTTLLHLPQQDTHLVKIISLKL